jgi:hypothetical protein
MRKILSLILFAMLLMGVAMATDTAITAVTTLTGENSYAAMPTWQAAPTSTNTVYIAYDSLYRYFISINVTAVGTSPKLNIESGNNPPAWRSGIGDLAISLTNNTLMTVGPLESARFVNTTGYLKFSTTNVTTGKIWILKVKRWS